MLHFYVLDRKPSFDQLPLAVRVCAAIKEEQEGSGHRSTQGRLGWGEGLGHLSAEAGTGNETDDPGYNSSTLQVVKC